MVQTFEFQDELGAVVLGVCQVGVINTVTMVTVVLTDGSVWCIVFLFILQDDGKDDQ